jgi:putative FmdB family regulatory protein
MATYEYRCAQDGLFDVIRPLGTAPESAICPVCGSTSRRVLSAPTVRRSSQSAWFAAVEHAEKSRYEPEVVTSLPQTGARKPTRVVPLTPKLRGLPRP